MYAVCHLGAVPNVCGSDCAGAYSGSGYGLHESESRLCRLNHQSTADAAVQSSGADRYRYLRRRMQHHAFHILQGAAKEAQASRVVKPFVVKTTT